MDIKHAAHEDLWAAHYECATSYRRLDSEDGLTALERYVLTMLASTPDLSAAGLRAHIGGTSSSISLLVRHLSAKGLLRAERVDGDRRRRVLTLTRAGAALARRHRS